MKANFYPEEGMIIKGLPNGNGWKGEIEHVGKDYFILRSARTGEPVLIKASQYDDFDSYNVTTIKEDFPTLPLFVTTLGDNICKNKSDKE